MVASAKPWRYLPPTRSFLLCHDNVIHAIRQLIALAALHFITYLKYSSACSVVNVQGTVFIIYLRQDRVLKQMFNTERAWVTIPLAQCTELSTLYISNSRALLCGTSVDTKLLPVMVKSSWFG